MTTMTSLEALAAFETISNLTGEMSEAARAGEWDRLASLEGRCASVVAALEEAPPVKFPPHMQRRKIELIQKIMVDDAEIRSYTEPWMKKFQTFLGNGSGLVGRMRRAQRRIR